MGDGNEKWCVVGGGLLGLTLAHRLARAGREVIVIESAPALGGLAGCARIDGLVWDRFYHVILLSDSHLRGLLGELGLEEDLRWVETRTGCFADGQVHSLSSSVEMWRFPLLGPIDKLRLAGTALYASRIRNGRRLEEISVSDWLERWSGKRAFERFWRPMLKAKLGDDFESASAAFIWASIARLYAARRTGLKREMFGYASGGYARILSRFQDALQAEGVSFEIGRRVTSVRSSAGVLRVVLEDGWSEEFDEVAVTLAPPLAAELCKDLPVAERRRLRAVRYQGIVCCSFLLNRPLPDFYVTYLLEDDLPFTGVINMSAVVETESLGGKDLVYLPRYVPPEDPLFAASDETLRGEFLQGLQRVYPEVAEEDVVASAVSRAKYVYAVPTIGYSAALPPIETSIPGLHLVSSAHVVNGTLNVNETVKLAEVTVTSWLDSAA